MDHEGCTHLAFLCFLLEPKDVQSTRSTVGLVKAKNYHTEEPIVKNYHAEEPIVKPPARQGAGKIFIESTRGSDCNEFIKLLPSELGIKPSRGKGGALPGWDCPLLLMV